MRILICRTDRIGDVVLSTPVFEAIKKHIQGAYLVVMVHKGVKDVLSDNPFIDEFIAYDPGGVHNGKDGILKLSREIREKHIDTAVELFMSFYPALAVKLAGIKRIIGPGSRVYSPFLLTDVIKQHRKQSHYNEAAYNLMLLKPLGIDDTDIRPHVYLSDNKDGCERFLLNQGIKPFSYFVVHPGMGGSAKNLPADHYAALIRAIVDKYNVPVVITGSYVDIEFVNGIIIKFDNDKNIKDMCCVLSMQQLKTVLFFSQAVIAPSTGPMHIAAALGRPVVTLFSPVKAQSKTRWAPYLLDNVAIVEPDVQCNEKYHCNKKCLYYDCMDTIKTEDVMKKLERLLGI